MTRGWRQEGGGMLVMWKRKGFGEKMSKMRMGQQCDNNLEPMNLRFLVVFKRDTYTPLLSSLTSSRY